MFGGRTKTASVLVCALLLAVSVPTGAHAKRTREQRNHMLVLEDALDGFQTRAERYLGPRSGSWWVDYTKDSIIVHFGVVEPKPGDLRALRDPYWPGLVPRIEPVRFSYGDLNRYADVAARIWERFSAPCCEIAFDDKRNRIVMTLRRENPQLQEALRRRIPTGALLVRVNPDYRPASILLPRPFGSIKSSVLTLVGSPDALIPPLRSLFR